MADQSEEQLGLHSVASYIDDIAINEGLHDVTYTVKPDAKAGGYMGVMNRVTLKGKRGDGTVVSMPLVFKDQPSNEFRREQFRTADFFTNEAAFYNIVLPAFEQLQEEKGIRGSDRFVSFPRRFYAGEVVVLEDMSPLGFKLANRQIPLDMAHCSLVMRELGILHAFSFAMRDQKPKEFARVKDSVKEVLMVTLGGSLVEHWNYSVNRAYEKFIETSPKDGKLATVLKSYCDDSHELMSKAVESEKAEPYAVISHGDCWTNNYLFKYADIQESLVPEALCFLDFQLSRYSSPACDLMYFISCCTDKTTRAQHFDTLLHDYHDSLSSFLLKLGSDPEKLFPFSALQNQLDNFGSFGMGMAILALPMVADDPDKVVDLDTINSDNLAEMGASENPLVWKRMSDLVEDMVAFGYIQ